MGITRRDLKSRAKAVLRFRYWQFLAVIIIYIILPSLLTPSLNEGSVSQSVRMRYVMLTYGGVMGFSMLINIFILSPLYMAICRYILKSSEDTETKLSVIWGVLRDDYFNLLKAGFMKDLFLALWSIPYAVVVGASSAALYITALHTQGVYALLGSLAINGDLALLIIVVVITLLTTASGILLMNRSYAYGMVNYIMADHPETDWREALAISKRMMKKKKLFAFGLDLSFLGWYLLGAMAMGIGIYFVQPYVAATQAQFYMALKNE